MKRNLISMFAIVLIALLCFTGCANFKLTVNPDAAAVGAEILGHRLGYALAKQAPANVDLYLTQAQGLLTQLQAADPSQGPSIAVTTAFGILAAQLSGDPLLASDIQTAAKLVQFNVAPTDPAFAVKYKEWLAAIQGGVTGFSDGIKAYQSIAKK
jgi:hypothetical protein